MDQNRRMPKVLPTLSVNGVSVWQALLDRAAQNTLIDLVGKIAETAPFYTPVTPSGRPMSVEMTSAGRLGWITDRQGYRYEAHHPNGTPWPDIPDAILDIWFAVYDGQKAPTSCLINRYREGARMGLHQDKDEGDFSWPVVSVSLGDDALFRVGGQARKDPTQSIWLKSGDVAVLSGDARLAYHGVDRIRPGSSTLVPGGGRINLTLRVVAL